MSKKTVMGLGVVAAVLLAYIVLVDRGAVTSGELEDREGTLLTTFVRDRVERVVIRSGEEEIELVRREREPSEDEAVVDEQVYEWFLARPVEARADQDSVASLLGSLEWARALTTLESISDDDRDSFGLADPRAEVEFVVAGQAVTVSVGGDSATGGGVYVSVSGAGDAYVVPTDLLNALTHDVDHFRDKQLFATTAVRGASALAIDRRTESGEESLRFEDDAGIWWLREPLSGLAASAVLEDLVRGLSELEATRFVHGVSDEEAGLDSPRLRLSGRDADDHAFSVAVGEECPSAGEAAEVALHFVRVGEGPLACARTQRLNRALDPIAELRELRILYVPDHQLDGFTVSSAGRLVHLDRVEAGGFTYAVNGAEPQEAETAAADTWLQGLAQLRGDAIVEAAAGDVAAGDVAAGDVAEGDAAEDLGSREPLAELTVHRLDQEDVTVRFYAREDEASGEGGQVLALRQGDAAPLRMRAEDLQHVILTGLEFRPRTLYQLSDDEVRAVTVTRGSVRERVERGESGRFNVVSPLSMPADAAVMREVVRRFGNLTVTDFVAERPETSHGFGDLTVELSLAPGEETEARTQVVHLGRLADGGVFAQLEGDDVVFLLPGDMRALVSAPLSSRDVLATGRDDLETLTLDLESGTTELVRTADGFAQPDGAPVDAERTQSLRERLAHLRAVDAIAYRQRDPGPRRARVTVGRDADAPEPHQYHLDFFHSREDGSVVVRRADLGVDYALAEDVANVFLQYEP